MTEKKTGNTACDCGCGQSSWLNSMRTIEVEVALDESLRRTAVGKRFLVLPGCYDAFIDELRAMKLLNDITRRYMNSPWWVRLPKFTRILKLQHLVNDRNKGFESTRRRAIRSAIMFSSPQRVAGWFDSYWRWRDRTLAKVALWWEIKRGRVVQTPPVEPEKLRVSCARCGGSGLLSPEDICGICNGTGFVETCERAR